MNDPFIGKMLGHYEIVARLGHGGMADVYRAWQPSMSREVAVKILSSALSHDQLFVERFTREVQTIARLEHRHIVPVYEYGKTEDGVIYLAMRYLKGGTLADLIKARGALPLTLVDHLLQQIASALDYAHQKGVIHRDIKPSNILLDEEQNAYLGDFGLARADEDLAKTLTRSGTMIGTPMYVAPEVIQSGRADSRSDLYSLGIVLYEMVTGKPPFTSGSIYALMQAHLNRQPPRPSALRTDLPQAVERVLLRAIHKQPAQRYQSALELAQDFRLAMQQAPTHPHPISVRTILTRTSNLARSRPRLFGLGVTSALILILGLFVLLPSLSSNYISSPNVPTYTAAAAALPYADESARPEVGSPSDLKNSPEDVNRARRYLAGSFIGVMLCTLSTDYHASLASSIRTYADQLGLRVEMEDSQADEFRQPIILRRLVARGAKAIVICPLNYESITPAVREAQAAGIATVVIGDNNFGRYSLNMSLTNEDIGRAVGEHAARLINTELNSEANVAILDFPSANDVLKRSNAMEDAVRQLAPRAKILGRWLGGTLENGELSMREILSTYPEVNVLLSINDAGALGAVRALEAAGRPPDSLFIISVDAESEARRLMRERRYFRASLDSNPSGVGKLALDAVVAMLSGRAVPRRIALEGVMITREMLRATPTP
ncbi:MAG: protein kinase [Anaerolineae bacterium]|nr:protein kinase [Anaerolineae bacterium]